MTAKRPIFRKAALDRLSSPEQLDEAIRFSNLGSWVPLAAIGLLIFAALVWGIFGKIPSKVHGEGILIKGGSITKASAIGAGQMEQLLVSVGTVVTQGQVVATVRQPQLEEQISSAKLQLKEIRQQHETLKEFAEKDVVQEIELAALRKSNLEQQVTDLSEQLVWLKEKMTNQEKLVEQGLLTKQTLLTTKQTFYSCQHQIETARSDLKQLSNKNFQLTRQKEQDLFTSLIKLNEAERRLKDLEQQYALIASARSPSAGRILEVMVEPGDILASGTTLFSMEQTGLPLQAVVYVPAGQGKKVLKGMTIQVVPSTFEKVEYGFILGRVTSVAEFPSTQQAITSVLENEQLAQKMMAGGPPIAIEVGLQRDPKTISGFAWSSSAGPPQEIFAGTLCTASVVVSQQRPISLVIPALKKILGAE